MQQNFENPFLSKNERLADLEQFLITNPEITRNKEFRGIDLHIHSNYSDGYWTPTSLVFHAFKAGLKTFALTDHDGFAGIDEAFDAVELCNKIFNANVEFIPGIEISTNYFYGTENTKKEIHILGYWPHTTKSEFIEIRKRIIGRDAAYFDAFQRNRTLRIYEMSSLFNTTLAKQIPELKKVDKTADVFISDKTVHRGLRNSIAPGRMLTVTGIFQLYNLYKQGKINEITDETFSKDYLQALSAAFDKFTSPQDVANAFFGTQKPSALIGYMGLTEKPSWAVEFIHSLGGFAVLAHPTKYIEACKTLIPELLSVKLDGIEIYSDYCTTLDEIRELETWKNEHCPNVFSTVGSDCHGYSLDKKINYRPNTCLGLCSALKQASPNRAVLFIR